MKGHYKPKGMVEAYQHNGSSTSAGNLHRWVNEGYYPRELISTRDIRGAEIMHEAEGYCYILNPTEWLVKENNLFFVMTDEMFKDTYEEI